MENIFFARPPKDMDAACAAVEARIPGAGLVWVDNSADNARQWGFYPVYLSEGCLVHDAMLPLGDYFLILYSGDTVEKAGDGWTIRGGYSYGCGGYCHTGDIVRVDREGVCTLGAAVDAPEQLGLGLCYAVWEYDSQTQRHIVRSVFAPVFCFPGRTALEVTYFPSLVGKNRITLPAGDVFPSQFCTVFARNVSLRLPDGFAFVPAVQANIDGSPGIYFTPAGTAEAVEAGGFLPGLSGAEYFSLKAGNPVVFQPGGRAWFEDVPLGCIPSTAYLVFPGSLYHTQPQNGSYYAQSDSGIYEFAELPGVMVGDVAVPAFPYPGGGYHERAALRLEERFLAPTRRAAVGAVADPARMCTGKTVQAVTRHGMTAEMDGGVLRRIRLVSTGGPGLAFTQPAPVLRLALLANRLFFAMGELGIRAGTPYMIDEERLGRAEHCGYPDCEKLRMLCGQSYQNEREFAAALTGVQAAVTREALNACDCFNVKLAGWQFHLSPRLWKENGSLLVEKLDEQQSLDQWLTMPEAWSLSLPEEEAAEAMRILTAVRRQCDQIKDLTLEQILYDRRWKGTVVFSTGVDLGGLPPQLSFLADGIQPERFRALYVAFPAASLPEGETAGSFALIDYHDEAHLQYEDFHAFGFKVLELRLKIENGQVCEFRAKVEFLVNQLFGCRANGYGSDSGNNLIFDGSLQSDESGTYYAFVITRPQSYRLELCGIQDVTIDAAALRATEDGCIFVLDGRMTLYPHPDMDVLSYDHVGFRGFTVGMKRTGTGNAFCVQEEAISFHPEQQTAREGSFAAGFPAKLTRLVRSEGRTVEQAGFTPLNIRGGARSEALGTDWRGLVWEVRTGNMGGLAAAADLTLELLAAWTAPNQTVTDARKTLPDRPLVLCGICIGAAGDGDDWVLSLQGVMSLGFDTVELHRDQENGSWYFRFRNFSLTVLGKRFPETNNDLYLIADGEGRMGWYGAVGK